MIRRKALLLFFFLAGAASMSFMRQQQTVKVLVFPFNRFEFHTEYKIETINEVNNTSGDQYFSLLKSAFSEAFELNRNQKIFYKTMTEEDQALFNRYVRYELESGQGHYTCNLDDLDKNLLKEILDGYDCDYLLTVNWYRIIRDRTSYKKNSIRKIALYSYHYVDYDVFTREKTRIRKGTKLELQVPANEDNAQYLGLRIQDLKPEYGDVVEEISTNILSK